MRLSNRSRFAIAAMIDLALRDRQNPVSLHALARRHGVSQSYLEQVFAKLRRRGLVASARGPGGGYTLGLRDDRISLADIIGVVEDDSRAYRNHCMPAQGVINTQPLWESLHKALFVHMQTVSLKHLAEEQRSMGFTVEPNRPPKTKMLRQPKAQQISPNIPNSVFTWASCSKV